jgi:adenosylhomocysteinase
MDMSFAIQALSAEFIAKHRGGLKPRVYAVPAEVDRQVAFVRLAASGLTIDKLSAAQRDYIGEGD